MQCSDHATARPQSRRHHPVKFVLVRHGATEWSVSGRHTGTTDLPLTGDGEAQARRAGNAIRAVLGDEFDTAPIFASPRLRATATAAILFGPSRAITIDEDLREFEYGAYEGLTSAQISALDPGWDLWSDGCPDGETAEMVGRRCDRFLVAAAHGGPTVVAVAHGHLLRILAARAVGLNANDGAIFTLDTATISVVEDVKGKRVVRLWNLDPALRTVEW